MKKHCLLALVSFLCLNIFAQLPVDSKTNKISYKEIIEKASLTQRDIHLRAKNWVAAKKLKKVSDDGMKMVYSGAIGVKYPSVVKGRFENGRVNYKLTIYCKDGKFKYIFTNFEHEADHASCGGLESESSSCNRHFLVPASWSKIKNQTETKMNELIKDLVVTVRGVEKAPAVADDEADF